MALQTLSVTTASNMPHGTVMDAVNVIIAGMGLRVKCIQDIVIYYVMAVPDQQSQIVMSVQQTHMTVMVNVSVSYTGRVLTARNILVNVI